MNRSEINEILKAGDAFIRSFGYVMPPFAYLAPDDLIARMQSDSAGILSGKLGWDITDFGSGRFADMGLFLFSVRNGSAEDLKSGRGMLYAEKIMISRKNQVCPMHRHIVKAEDIINRGGGTLVLELFESKADGTLCHDSPVNIVTDGRTKTLRPGGLLSLDPGESVTLMPGSWHAFWAEGSDVLIGEVSTVNDDLTDNIFRDPVGRFAAVNEDDKPVHLLVSDYDTWLKKP